MTTFYKHKSGRVWVQRKKFETFKLLLPYGMTNINDPVGALNAIREPSAVKRGVSVIADIIHGEPGLPGFTIETRLQRTLNYLFGMKDCNSQFQAHLGTCDRPDNYYAADMILHWERAHRGDLTIDRLSQIEGDDAAVQTNVPFVAEVGPVIIDAKVEFLSARTILETEAVRAMAFLSSECLEDCLAQEDAGENGYLVTEALGGSPTNIANVWYTEDGGETWANTSAKPLTGGLDISDIIVSGTKASHRIIVSCGTTQVSGHAQVAYADVTAMGVTPWVTVDVGVVDGQYINALFMLDWNHVYAVTDDGYVYISDDGGATWAIAMSTAGAAFFDIDGLSNGIVIAVGEANMLYLSKDFGVTWDLLTGPAAGAGDDVLSVHMTPDGTIFIGNDAGELYGSYDLGYSWTALGVQGVTPTAIDAIDVWGDSIIWIAVDTAAGGRVLRSMDGGASFRLWSLNIPTNAGINCLATVDPNVVFAGGEPQGGTAFITRTTSNIIG
jgi:hypothetical protein